MPRSREPQQQFPVKLTQAQRKVVAELAPELAKRLKPDDQGQRAVPLTLAELRAVAGRYQWQYLAPDRQQQVEQIAYRLWQEEGCPHGRHEEHWRYAEKEFHAGKPIRGAILDGPETGQVGQLLSPLQAVAHARTGVVYTASSIVKLTDTDFLVTPGEAGAIDAAADASSEGYSAAFRTGIAQAVGLER